MTQLKKVSPHLAFFAEAAASELFLLKHQEQYSFLIQMALASSKSRQKSHERGEYTPQIYGGFYPRDQFINDYLVET